MPSWDTVHSTGLLYPPTGILANIVGYLRRKRRVFVLDADVESILELQIEASSIPKAILLRFVKTIYYILIRFCVRTSYVTFAVGDTVFTRYKNYGNVHKIHVSNVHKRDIISSEELEEKILRIQKCELKIMVASNPIVPRKGQRYAVEASRILTKEMGIPASLDIYGDGSMRGLLEDMVKSYHLSDIAHFEGVIPYGNQFYACLRAHDCIVIPIVTEELPRILFDALANGTAVVASNTNAIRDVVSDSRNAILVAAGDPTEIATAIRRLHLDRKLLSEIIRNGVNTAKDVAMEINIRGPK